MGILRSIIATIVCSVVGVHVAQAQLYINEVSNGPSGAQEYVELVVVGTPSCTAQCVDLRGWIIDDNNGYFATGSGTGIAQGHMRFANDATWQCVPIGTIIVIYNESDRNASIPPDNATGANCRYILPASSTLFERNTTTPSVAAGQAYSGPYVAGGAWATQGLSNSEDTYQVRNPSNTNVPYHAVGYGNNTTNSIIYFAGSGGQTVYSMVNTTNNNPALQANWASGDASTDQTPGAPNNTANATWINAMNNNCSPVTGVQVTLGPDQTICAGQSITVTATAPVPGTFTWNVPGSGSSITLSPTANTQVIVNFDAGGGCTDADTLQITVNPAPNGSISGDIDICIGESTTLTASGGTSYLWSTTDITAAITVSPTTNTVYTVTITDANGCADTVSSTVNVNALPNASISGNTSVCSGGSTTLTASGGTSYVWSTTANTAVITVSPTTNTTYTVTVTNASGCSATAAANVTVNPAPVGTISGSTTICSGGSTTLTASGGTSYLWSTTANTAAITVSPASNTTYTVTITDANGCSTTQSATVTVGSSVIGTVTGNLTICAGQSTTLTASGGSTYQWSNNQNTAAITVSPTTTTTYSVTVSSGSTCADTVTVTVTVNANPLVGITGDTDICEGESTTLTATGGSTYIWNTSAITPAITVSPTTTTSYNVTVTDGNGCTGIGVSTVNVNPIPTANAGDDQIICEGSTVFLTATGGSTYAWSNNQTTATIAVSPATTTDYAVTVTNAGGCTDADTITVTVNPNLIVLALDSVSPETCNLDNGTIILQSPSNFITYVLYQNGNAVDSVLGGGVFFDLDAGTYDVIARDNNGCQRNLSNIIVPGVTAPPFTVAVANPLCNADVNGSIIITGANTLRFSLNGGVEQTSGSFTNLAAGDYIVEVRDSATGCDTILNLTLTQPDALVATIAPDSANIITGDAVELVSDVTGGTTAYTYNWVPSNGLDCDTCPTVAASPTDSLNQYVLTVTDANGCVDTARTVVRVSNEFIITVPTGFTPNGDGSNDWLRPLSNEPIDFHLMVFNRWGEKIYDNDGMPGWNGVYKGEPQPIATYVYVIEYTRLLNGATGYLTGSITLLR